LAGANAPNGRAPPPPLERPIERWKGRRGEERRGEEIKAV